MGSSGDANSKEAVTAPALQVRGLTVVAGTRALIREVSFTAETHQVFGIIGPSGAGKSTLLRAINRLTDLVSNVRVTGEVQFRGMPVYSPGMDVNWLRSRVGMLFQQPVIFPATIAENVLFGVKRLRRLSRAEREQLVEHALREASLWAEVKDRLRHSAGVLSVGQQQRLCLARTLALEPELILMDEPTSALDPKSTQAIEELIVRLKERHTIILVTHNISQARRVADQLGCLCVRDGCGQLVETGPSQVVLERPHAPELIDYLAHR